MLLLSTAPSGETLGEAIGLIGTVSKHGCRPVVRTDPAATWRAVAN
jgi:hypothetical protein